MRFTVKTAPAHWSSLPMLALKCEECRLTPYQAEAVRLAQAGNSAAGIGELLGIAPRPLKELLRTAARKLGARGHLRRQRLADCRAVIECQRNSHRRAASHLIGLLPHLDGVEDLTAAEWRALQSSPESFANVSLRGQLVTAEDLATPEMLVDPDSRCDWCRRLPRPLLTRLGSALSHTVS